MNISIRSLRSLLLLSALVTAQAVLARVYAEEQSPSVSGPVSSVDIPGKLVRLLGDTITLDAKNATITALDGKTIPLAQLDVGTEVRATLEPVHETHHEGPLPARTIVAFITPTGTITGKVGQVLGPDRFSILGQIVRVDANTKFEGEVHGHPVDGILWLIPNTTLVVELAAGTPLTALRVTALPRKPVQVIVTQGTLFDIVGNQWIVHELGGRVTTFDVPQGTEIVNGPALPADTVIVHARIEPELNLATRIEVLRAVPSGPCAGPSLRLDGTLTARSADSITVDVERRGPTTLRVTDATRFHGDPQVGDKVYVEGDYDAAGGLTARNVVERTEHPAPMVIAFEGTITAKNAHEWTIGEYTVVVFESTTISGTPEVGDRVRVRGVTTSANPKFVSAQVIQEL